MATKTTSGGFSAEERAAMLDRAAELEAQAAGADGERAVLTAIEEMPEEDEALALGFHELVRDVAPDLVPRTWYGMPAYATPGKKGKVVCFFQGATQMGTRYNTIGFSDAAALDQGSMCPTSYAVLKWNATNEKQLRALVRKAVG